MESYGIRIADCDRSEEGDDPMGDCKYCGGDTYRVWGDPDLICRQCGRRISPEPVLFSYSSGSSDRVNDRTDQDTFVAVMDRDCLTIRGKGEMPWHSCDRSCPESNQEYLSICQNRYSCKQEDNRPWRFSSYYSSIVIDDGITSISDYAFFGCGGFILTLPDSLQTIGKYAFAKCSHAQWSFRSDTIVFPKGLKVIGEGAFSDCAYLKEITLPNTIERIEKDAFRNCERLETIILPDKPIDIDPTAFSGCPAMRQDAPSPAEEDAPDKPTPDDHASKIDSKGTDAVRSDSEKTDAGNVSSNGTDSANGTEQPVDGATVPKGAPAPKKENRKLRWSKIPIWISAAAVVATFLLAGFSTNGDQLGRRSWFFVAAVLALTISVLIDRKNRPKQPAFRVKTMPARSLYPNYSDSTLEQMCEGFLLSQYAALYTQNSGSSLMNCVKNQYLKELDRIGIPKEKAEKLFAFEYDVCQRHGKPALLDNSFIRKWFMGLKHPYFVHYPSTEQEIIKERFFTIGEMCKLIDEAEWLYWNCHEMDLGSEVFGEISKWRRCGKGAEAAYHYFESIREEIGVSMEDLKRYVNREGSQLNRYKWSQPLLRFEYVIEQDVPNLWTLPKDRHIVADKAPNV
jgi:hypothetical protein